MVFVRYEYVEYGMVWMYGMGCVNLWYIMLFVLYAICYGICIVWMYGILWQIYYLNSICVVCHCIWMVWTYGILWHLYATLCYLHGIFLYYHEQETTFSWQTVWYRVQVGYCFLHAFIVCVCSGAGSVVCPRTWDGWQCWDDTVGGETASSPCQEHVYFRSEPSTCPSKTLPIMFTI